MKKILRRIFKIIAWCLFSIVLLLILLFILIQIPAVQNYVKTKVVAYLENTIHTKVEIGKLSIDFPSSFSLQKIYMEDQRNDTLLACDSLAVDISMLKLISTNVAISSINIKGLSANVYRLSPDTSFNFDYIIKAFSPTDTLATEETKPSSWKISLGNITLNNIRLDYNDDVSGYDGVLQLDNLRTTVKTFDLAKSKYDIPDIQIAGIQSNIKQYAPKVFLHDIAPADTAKSAAVDLALKKITLRNINLAYNSEISKMLATINLDLLGVLVDKIDLNKADLKIKKIELQNNAAAVTFDKFRKAVKTVSSYSDTTKKEAAEWKVAVTSIALTNNSIKFDDNNFPRKRNGLDYNHISVNPFNFVASNLLMSNDSYAGKLDSFSMKEQCGFEVKKLEADFRYNGTETYLKDFVLRTNNSRINAALRATYTSTADFTKNPAKVFAEASVDTCLLSVNEILLLQPVLSTNLGVYKNSTIRFTGKAKGFISDINIPEASVSGIGNTSFAMNGNIRGLPDTKLAFYNVNITKLATTRKDLLKFIPPSAMPSLLRIPETIKASGYFKGTTTAFSSKLDVKTSNGAAIVVSKLNLKSEQFDVDAMLNDVDLGYILSQDTMLGEISMTAKATGKGYDYRKMSAVVNANVTTAFVNGYEYKNLILEGKTAKGQANINSSVDDENLRLQLTAEADVTKRYPAVKMNLQLDTVNLHELYFYNDTFGLKTNLSADFICTNPDSLVGNLLVEHLGLYTAGKHLTSDSIMLETSNAASVQSLKFFSVFAKADWTGKYKLTEVAPAIAHTLNHYFKIDGFKDTVFTAQQWSMNISLNPMSKVILAFVPELEGSDSIKAAFNYDSDDDFINTVIDAPAIKYSGQAIDSLQLKAATSDGQFNYTVTAAKAEMESMHLFQPSLYGYAKDNNLITNIALNDKNGLGLYHIGTTLSEIPAGLRLSLSPDSLLLNRNKWYISADNFIEYDSVGLLVNNFSISKADESMQIRSTAPLHNAPLETSFKNFRIKTLTEFVGNDSLEVDGLVNGSVTVRDLKTNPLFTSDITIETLQYIDDTLGNILARISNPDEQTLLDTISVSGFENDMLLTGRYSIKDQEFRQHLVINNVDMKQLVVFSAGQVRQADGSLKGDIEITGKSKDALITGDLYFDDAFIIPSLLGERLNLPGDKIIMDNKGVHFNQYTLKDSAGNKAILDGSLLIAEAGNYNLALDINADDFQLVNSNKKDNKDFYGKLNIDAAVKLRGDLQTPDVNATLRVNRQTDFTIALPDVNPEVQDREGVVNFIDPNNPVDTSMYVEKDTVPTFKMLAGLKLSTNIETDTAAQFTVVIDEQNGDVLKLKGNADLATTIDENGKVSLTGTYELQQGSYQITLSVLKRKFDIQKGSTLTWSGDPMHANVDITAAYKLKAPTIELMQPDLAGKSEEETNKYKERLPITVLLKMKGDLLKPDISFDITIPEDIQSKWDDVEYRLKQLRSNESDMSKQVFALLLLSRFVEEDPMAQSAGGTTEGLVRESVSRMLSDQLNTLAGSLVKGVDLNVDLNSSEDYTSGSRQYQTDLKIGVSKTLLNDRLKVNVGSNFLLEGANANQATSNIAGDVAVDYALSVDGRYRIRAYRKNQYEGAVEGQIVESGLTFIITVNYNKFKELFQKNKPDKKDNK